MANIENTCRICEESQLTAHCVTVEQEYRGHTKHMPLKHSECDFCGSDQVDNKEARDNKRAMLAFKKEADRSTTHRII